MDATVHDNIYVAEKAGRFVGTTDPYALTATFRRNLRLFSAVLLGVVAAAIVATCLTAPKYTATAGVLLDPRKRAVTGIQDVLSDLPADTSVVDTEVEILKSRALAERVVATLKLDRDPEFNADIRAPGPHGRAPAALDARELQARHEKVVENVLSRLKVVRSGLTYLIEVSFKSRSAAKAAQIANAFTDGYVLEQLEAKSAATRQANSWLSSQLDELRDRLLHAEEAVEQYKVANGLMSAAGNTLTEQEISNLDQQLAAVKLQQAESEARLTTARRQMAHGSKGDDLGEALDSHTISELRQQRAQVSGVLARLESRYGPRHPEVLKAQQQLADVDAQIHAEIRRIVSNLEVQAQVQRQRTASLESSLAESRHTLAANDRASVGLHELERNAQSVRALYETLLNRFKQTGAQEDIQQPDARVVWRAQIPTKPSAPVLALNIALGLMLGLGAGVGAVAAREALDTGVSTAEELEAALELPYLAGIPSLPRALNSPAEYVIEKPLSAFAEAFRALRASLQLSRLGAQVKVIAITSAMSGEGKTTASVCLARVMAMAGDSVILVDCDLRERSVSRVIGAEAAKCGLLEVLAGTAALAAAVRVDKRTGAHYLPLAQTADAPQDVFGSAAMDQLLEALRAMYDVVVLDTAPVLPLADTRVIAAKADVVALLVRWRKTPRKTAIAGLKLLQAGEACVGGAAIARINTRRQARYGDGDPGCYHRAHRKYYRE